LPGINPYKFPAGTELDGLIHERLFVENSKGQPLNYSSSIQLADKVKAKVKSLYGHPVVAGETKSRPKRFFARFENDPSTSTEVLAETYPLAICRLALLLSEKRG
jgi:hypothetical protein